MCVGISGLLLRRQDEEAEKKEEEMRQKIADMKKQRAVAKRVLSKKGLGDVSDDEDDDIAAWVERSRKKQKLQAEKLAKQLQEQDEFEDDGAYGARDLAGMKVQHDSSAFEAGETVILTLADSRILKREHGNADVNSDEVCHQESATKISCTCLRKSAGKASQRMRVAVFCSLWYDMGRVQREGP